jgi:hypothetical protein
MKTILIFMMFAVSAFAQEAKPLQEMLDKTVAATFEKFPALKKEELTITAIDLKERGHPQSANYRGDVPIYPASVVKLFYLEAAHRWMEDGKLKETEELRRALKDMIVLSYNEATHYVVDSLTETTSGPELPAAEMEKWAEKRNAVNRYFKTRGFEKINVNQKPWCEGPYGRDRIFVGQNYTNRNMLTTDATAKLLLEMATDAAVSPTRSRQMLELMARKLDVTGEGGQVKGFTGEGLPAGSKLWSKAGWTSTTRHDAALVELPDGKKFILVTFTVNHANDASILPFVAKTFTAGLE